MYKMIIVDDEYYTCEGMKGIIDWASYGIEVVATAADGIEGLEIIRSVKPDIVMTDIKMQAMDGLDMIEQLRNEGFGGEIIILSGHKVFEFAQRAIDEGVKSYLLKPVSVEKLHETVRNMLQSLKEKEDSRAQEEIAPSGDTIRQIVQYVNAHYAEEIRLFEISKMFYMEVAHLSKKFKEYTGVNYVDYLIDKRLERAKKLLTTSDMTINDIMFVVGYQDAKYFRNIFKKKEGMSPYDYRLKYKQRYTDN